MQLGIGLGQTFGGADVSYGARAAALAPSAWWRLDEAGGTTAADSSGNSQTATYASAGITYRADMGHSRFGATFDGNNTYVNIDTSINTFDDVWNGNLYSLVAWARVDGASRWTDATTFRYPMHLRATDSTYYTTMGKSTTSHQLSWRRRTGGVITELTYTFSPSGPTDEFCMGLTVDQSSPLMIAYLWDSVNGFREVARSTSANLTAWTGNPPQGGASVLAAGSLTLQEWIGSMRDAMVFSGRALTSAQMQSVMTP